MGFVGRAAELDELGALLADVKRGGRADRGQAVLLRGRRRVGKSRLVSEFIDRSGLPAVYFQAARGAESTAEFVQLAAAVATSNLPNARVAEGNQPTTLTAALTLLAAALPSDAPSIAVLDEVPWLLEGIPSGAGELQRVWDRTLAAKPVLLLLLGSDLAMMEALTAPDAPFHGRGKEMVLDVLTPRDVGRMTGLHGIDAFDAYLITGGLPLVAQEWHRGVTPADFLAESLGRSTSALVVSGSRVLDTEFPQAGPSRAVLTAIGGLGERSFTAIQKTTSALRIASTLNGALDVLATKRVIAADEPLSNVTAAKNRRWRIADPSLRFWLAFIEPAIGDIDRGRPDLAVARIDVAFASWRGRAIEPVVRTALRRLLPNRDWPTTTVVGGWWPRNNNPEIDLVAADRYPATTISFAGSVTWRNKGTITAEEVSKLAADAAQIPGATVATPLVAVCPVARSNDPRILHTWTAADLLQSWP